MVFEDCTTVISSFVSPNFIEVGSEDLPFYENLPLFGVSTYGSARI